MKGYAYTGGGRKVIRVEVSLDAGKTWKQAKIQHMDSDNGYGKSWTWVFWNFELQVFDFLNTDQLLVRAVDSSQNIQPDKLTWNVMGMMNNCHFRIMIHKQLNPDGEICLRFQHPAPTELGKLGNFGWREKTTVQYSVSKTESLSAASSKICSTDLRDCGFSCQDFLDSRSGKTYF